MKQKMTNNEILTTVNDNCKDVVQWAKSRDARRKFNTVPWESYEYEPPENFIADVVVSNSSGTTQWYVCSKCSGAVDIGDNYCRYCGRQFVKDNGD